MEFREDPKLMKNGAGTEDDGAKRANKKGHKKVKKDDHVARADKKNDAAREAARKQKELVSSCIVLS